MKFKAGDKVIYICSDYYQLMKCDYNQPFTWLIPNEKDSDLKLGGEYKIQEVHENLFGRKYRLKGNFDFFVNKWSLKPAINSNICPFEIGDKVRFEPKCKKKEYEYISEVTKKYKGKTYFVRYVINKYYLIIGEKKESLNLDTIQYVDESTFPFRWIDFVKV